MRFKGVYFGFFTSRRNLLASNRHRSMARSYSTVPDIPPPDIPPSLTITHNFIDDNGHEISGAKPGSQDDSKTNDRAFDRALNSVGYRNITIPPGRYYFSKPIVMTNFQAGKVIQLPEKTIRGDTGSIPIPFSNLGYTLNCPSTILDFSFAEGTVNNPLIKIDGSRERFKKLIDTLIKGGKNLRIWRDEPRTIKDGDLLLIQNPNRYSYGVRAEYRRGEFLTAKKVKYDLPDPNVELVDASFDSYSQIPQWRDMKECAVTKVIPIQIHIENITIVDNHPKDAYDSRNVKEPKYMNFAAKSGLMITLARDSVIKNVFIVDASYNSGLSLRNCFRTTVNFGKYILGLPHRTRLLKKANDYSQYYPIDAYGIMITDSQDVTVDGVEAISWGHAIATGSGGASEKEDQPNDPVYIVNRNIQIKNSIFTNTPVNLYYNNEETPDSLSKLAPANFHGNIENSAYIKNVINGWGFNIGGHNITLERNNIYADNYDEPLNMYLRHGYSAFYFNEAKSAQFTIKNNYVHIKRFYQSQATEDHERSSGDEFRFGEFVHFNFGGVLVCEEFDPPRGENCSKKYFYWFCGMPQGMLEISNNCIRIDCDKEDQNNMYTSGLITINGVEITDCVHQFLFGSQGELLGERAIDALQDEMQIDVKISGNFFSIFKNPKNSTSLVAINTKRVNNNPLSLYWSRVRSVEIVNNTFCGHIRFSFNKSYIFALAKSDLIKVRDNKFFSDLTDVEAHINLNIDKTNQREFTPNPRSPYTRSCADGGNCLPNT